MKDRKTLKSEFETADAGRVNAMERVRECADLTLPSALPRLNAAKDADMVRPYQSLGAYGSTNLTNKLLLTIVPFGVSMFRFILSARIRADRDTTPEALAQLEAILYVRELLVQDQLEATRIRTRYRTAIEQLVILGNTLSMLTDDYQVKVFRLDQFVQKRTSGGDWLWVITHEKLDPLELTDEHVRILGKSREELEKRTEGLDLFTKCSKQRDGKTVIRQELEGKELDGSEEPISRYFPAGYVELPGEDYSRGFIEERLGSLRSYNGLTKAILDAAAASSKILFGIDSDRTAVTPSDLAKPSGSVVGGVRIVEGKWDGVGCLQADKFADMQVAFAAAKEIGDELSTQMLVESAVQPQGERVTAFQVNRIARELEGATGGIYAHVAEEMQAPLVKRLVWQMQKDLRLPALPQALEKEINVETFTGLEAMGRQRDAEKIQTLMQALSLMPDLVRYYKPEWMNRVIVRGLGIDETQALKSKEELDAEANQAAEMQAKMQLAQTAIETGGKVIQNASKPQATRPAQGQ